MQTKSKSNSSVLVALSGSTTSYVAANLLKTQGYQVHGLFLDLSSPPPKDSSQAEPTFHARCQKISALPEVRDFCKKAEIPLTVHRAWELFENFVVDPFVHDVISNKKPSPCTLCNSAVKLKLMIQIADQLGCEKIASAHHAQVFYDAKNDIVQLIKSVTPEFDETYLLFQTPQSVLKRLILPLGSIPRHLFLKLAIASGLNPEMKVKPKTWCFFGQEEAHEYVKSRTPNTMRESGVIQTSDGQIVGSHDGLYRYSIGQSEDLQLTLKSQETWYVTAFNRAKNIVVVGPESELYHSQLLAHQVQWVRPIDEFHTLQCQAKISQESPDASCQVELFENRVAKITFIEPQRSITPGQAVVFYEGQEVLGGGWIEKVVTAPPKKS